MKRSLLDILCCPVCKGDLALRSADEEGGEILEGGLFCGVCSVDTRSPTGSRTSSRQTRRGSEGRSWVRSRST